MFHGKRVLPNMKLGDICPSIRHVPELSMGLARGAASGSLISTTTTSDVRKVLATEAACSRQHLTTCMQFIVVRKRMFFLFISTQFIHTKQGVEKKYPDHSVNSQPGAKLLLVLSCSFLPTVVLKLRVDKADSFGCSFYPLAVPQILFYSFCSYTELKLI